MPVRQGVHTTEWEKAHGVSNKPGESQGSDGRAGHPLIQSLRYELFGESRASISSSPSERDNRWLPAAAVLQNTVKNPPSPPTQKCYHLFAVCRLIYSGGSSPSKQIIM